VFLAGIGSELDAQKIDITHRRRWAELLESV